ncbi:bacteriocin fulvocin C-related protein [Actinomadura sp. 6N118]|uniref:bacteriocin fulvocin C-related protein n=1 Tax=Actinomadura sp. 6N118 TaxID=3375151 RepID=UPI0037A102F8
MSKKDGTERWVLAFDASCGTCRDISHAVGEACAGRLEILPLTHQDVHQWRTHVFGDNPALAPTLLRIRDEARDVRAWASHRMAVPLIRHLGLRTTVRVLTALGRLRAQAGQPKVAGAQSPRPGMNRKQFLGLGVAVAGGVLLGKTPAFAQESQTSAKAWVTANRDRLPQTYQAFGEYQIHFRREIFRALPAPTRASLWREHIKNYRDTHRSLTGAQDQALKHVERFIAHDSVFDLTGPEPDTSDLRKTVTDAFSETEAALLLDDLGPNAKLSNAKSSAADCHCNMTDDYCEFPYRCKNWTGCAYSERGCGSFWLKPCDGYCG